MALRLSSDLKNFIINKAIAEAVCGTVGTGGTAVLKIYTGSQPASAEDAPSGTSGTLLCKIINLGWGTHADTTAGCNNGTAALATSVGYTGTAEATGTAGWARLLTYGTGYTGSAGTFTIDGDVGTAATCVFVINSVSIISGGYVTLLTAPIKL